MRLQIHVSLELEAVCESDALLARRSSWSIPSGVPRSNVTSPAQSVIGAEQTIGRSRIFCEMV